MNVTNFCEQHLSLFKQTIDAMDMGAIEMLADELQSCWEEQRNVFICGNGGSGGNADHIANDFIYPVSKKFGSGIKIQSLNSNNSVITCIANDEGYEHIFSYQLAILAKKNDVLIALSGSGNSKNIEIAIREAKKLEMKTIGIHGFDGGVCAKLVDLPIHFDIADMQIAEDMQMLVTHMVMKWLYYKKAIGEA